MQKRSIDTTYDGYKFRSRLEARWAIFFNQLGIRYSYEPVGFSMEGSKYLPDFLLQDSLLLKAMGRTQRLDKIWIEIKPSMKISEKERKKISQFVKEMKSKVLLIRGDPGPNSTIRLVETNKEGKLKFIDVTWVELNKDQFGLISIDDFLRDRKVDHQNLKKEILTNSTLRTAYMTARQARFEFGDESVILDPYGKKCSNCGQEFVPRDPQHFLCYRCFSDGRSGRKLQKPEHAIPPVKIRGRRIIIGAVVAISILLFGLIAYRFYSANSVESLADCACSSNIYDCEDFSTQNEAQQCFDKCYSDSNDVHYLDANDDLEACELLP